MQFLPPPLISFGLGPRILLSTQFLDIPSLLWETKVHTHNKTAGKATVLYILIFTF
jgi:hypothetical protein